MPRVSPSPVIVVAPLSPWLSQGLDEAYHVHRLIGPDGLADLPEAVVNTARVLVTTGGHPTPNRLLDALPALELVAVHGVGVDNVDLEHAHARGIKVSNTPDVLTDDVADMALALILATARRIVANDRLVRTGAWGKGAIPLGRRVTRLRFGILGLGRIGSAIARRLEPIAGGIAYHSRNPVTDSPYRYVDSATALACDSDVLVVATSGGPSSRRLVDAAVIAALGSEGMLINIGRGTTIDEAALVHALQDGTLGAAGLDVFEDEPHVPAALLALGQVVLQPHQASATLQTRMAMADLVLANIAAHFAGRPLPSPV